MQSIITDLEDEGQLIWTALIIKEIRKNLMAELECLRIPQCIAP